MKCPICGNKMKIKTQNRISYMDQIECEVEYEKIIYHVCKNKHLTIAYNETDNEWDIPYEIKVTEKQLRAARFIERYTDKQSPEVPLKYPYWKFIKKHLQEAIKNRNECTDWDDYDVCIEEPH